MTINEMTAKKIVDVIVDWCEGDEYTMEDMITLFVRIAEVKGSRSFTRAIDLLRSELKDRLP